MDYEIRQETITPQYARELLELNYSGQRNVSWRKVEEYAADMRAGLWDENVFEPVHITKNMVLLNGQHRLQAVVLAGTSVKMFVCYGGDEEQYKYIDGGTQRTVAAALKAPSATEAASIARIIYCLENGSTINAALNGKLPRGERQVGAVHKKTAQCSPSRGEIIHFYEENSVQIDDLVRQGKRASRALGAGTKTVFAVFVWIAGKCGFENQCADFLNDMREVPYKTAAAQTTAQTLISLKMANNIKGGNNRVNQMGTLLRGLDAFMAKQSLKLIKNQTGVCEKWTERLHTTIGD